MTKKQLPIEFLYQVFTLLIAFIIVHGVYVTLIRPQADEFFVVEQARLAEDSHYVQQRNFYVVIKDYEQEVCFVLMIWALAILGYKGYNTRQQRRQLNKDLLQLPATLPIGRKTPVTYSSAFPSFLPRL